VRAIDPFLFLSEDWFSRVGFDWHPHRGFETVTYVVSGELEHRDNAGGHGVLGPGDLQWVTAGRGVMHAELAHGRRPVHTLQLWLNLPAAGKLVAPRYQDLRGVHVPALRERGVEVRVFAGELAGLRGPAATTWPATVIDARLSTGGRFALEVPGEQAAFFFVLHGEVAAGPDRSRVRDGQVGWCDAGAPGPTAIEIVAAEPTQLVAYASAPIGEPIVAHGPFVMNSRAEIEQAILDYRGGLFGPIPG